jgi:hypothetical protein
MISTPLVWVRRRVAHLSIAALMILTLPGCGTVIIPRPADSYFIGVTTIIHTSYQGIPLSDVASSEYLLAFATDWANATGGSIKVSPPPPDFFSGNDGKAYIANAVAPARWVWSWESGPCDGLFAAYYFQNREVPNFNCYYDAPLIRAIGYLLDGTPVNTGGGDQLFPGESMAPEVVKTSADGRFHFKYQNDGNLVLYDENWSWRWQSGTSGTCPGTTAMQGDGNLVVYDCSGVPVWNAGTWGHNNVAGLVVRSDGNVTVYDGDTSELWSTGTGMPPPPPPPTGRWKVGPDGCYWDENDSGPDQCTP